MVGGGKEKQPTLHLSIHFRYSVLHQYSLKVFIYSHGQSEEVVSAFPWVVRAKRSLSDLAIVVDQ